MPLLLCHAAPAVGRRHHVLVGVLDLWNLLRDARNLGRSVDLGLGSATLGCSRKPTMMFQDDEAAMREYVSTAIRASLGLYLGVPDPADNTATIDRVKTALLGVLQRPVDVKQDGTVLHMRFQSTPEEAAGIAYTMYSEGQSHEDVTAWFDQHAPTFREHLAEVQLPDGTLQWIQRPSWICGTYTVPA